MNENKQILIRRYNIYSGMEITLDGVSICVDPAKIIPEVLEQLFPDIILISHESMDHLDPTQVYYLQKRKNAKIFCSIAVAVDLMQFFEGDIFFKDSIQVMLPGSVENYKGFSIYAGKSVHCDYMLPLFFKIWSENSGISIIHCVDSLISDEILKLSLNTSVGIIPIGIAKGISADSGIDFISRMNCSVYIPNHFTSQLKQCTKMIEELRVEEKLNIKFIPLEWNQYCVIEISQERIKNGYVSVDEIQGNLSKDIEEKKYLLNIIRKINNRKGEVLRPEFLKKITDILYSEENELIKIVLMILTIMVLQESVVLDRRVLKRLQQFLLTSEKQKEEIKAMTLFFLGIYAQQSGTIWCLKEVLENVNIQNEHIVYWVTECLGRMGVSRSYETIAVIRALEKLAKTKEIFDSVVVRRKLYWEFLRITKFRQSYSVLFKEFYEVGLHDLNPDVRLLSILCVGFMCRTNNAVERRIFEEMSKLYEDEEDDVRETYAITVYNICNFYPEIVKDNIDNIKVLTKDNNCHVKRAATKALESIGGGYVWN